MRYSRPSLIMSPIPAGSLNDFATGPIIRHRTKVGADNFVKVQENFFYTRKVRLYGHCRRSLRIIGHTGV